MAKQAYNILYVDDEQNNIVVFKSAFFRYYNIFTATSGQEALELLKHHNFHLIITDQKMKGMTGIDLLEKVVKLYPNIVRMILTAYSDIDVIMEAVNTCGIYQYILKPWDARDLKIIIDNAIESGDLKIRNKNLIEQLQNINENLEVLVTKRTQELEEKNGALHLANSIKDRLFTIISHDLKNPMAALKVFLDVIEKTRSKLSDEDLSNYTIKVRNYIDEITELIDNLLHWSINRQGRQDIVRLESDVSTLIQKSLSLFDLQAKAKEITLKTEISTDNILVFVDPDMIQVVLRNLISNAIKFTKKGGEITIQSKKEGDFIRLAVKDNGVGIDEKTLYTLQNRDEIPATTGTAHEKGNGLGIQICKEFLLLNKTRLTIESKLGEGSKFSFRIPIHQ